MDPDDLLSGPAIDAAVAALAERNRHHLEQMQPDEQADALEHWRQLAITVLTAARSASGAETAIDGQSHGRATIVLEDSGGEVSATPAQIAALELLDQLAGDEEEPED